MDEVRGGIEAGETAGFGFGFGFGVGVGVVGLGVELDEDGSAMVTRSFSDDCLPR